MTKKKILSIVSKTANRDRIINSIIDALSSRDILNKIDCKTKDESNIKTFMYGLILDRIKGLYRDLYPNKDDKIYEAKANKSLMWEGNKETVVNNIRFLGVQHRPDFKVVMNRIRIAIEIKKGDSGSSIREGIGQSIIYAVSNDFDFVIYLFIDTSKDKKIKESVGNEEESAFISSLWDYYNIRFVVI